MYSDNTKPIYLKIREDLLADLETNHNKKLPSELELCRRYGVCRLTVQKALEYFLENGMIVRRAGKGTFFRDEYLKKNAPPQRVRGIIRQDWEKWDTDYYFSNVIQGIMRTLGTECQFSLEQYSESLLYKLLADREAPTIWISPEQNEIQAMKKLSDLECSVIAVNRCVSYPGIHSVSVDHTAVGRFAAGELVRAGHRRVCSVYLESEQAFYRKVEAGFTARITEENLPLELGEALVPQTDWHREAATVFRKRLSVGERVFFVHTTALVPLLLEEFAASGLKPGRDVFLLVYGDSFDFENNGVSALRQPGMQLGIIAGKIALRQENKPKYLLTDLELMKRGSLYPTEITHQPRYATTSQEGILS